MGFTQFLSLDRHGALIRAQLCLLLDHIKGASNLGTELLKLNLQHDFFGIDHKVQGTGESFKVLRHRGSHSTLNTIADDRFSHGSANGNPNPRWPSVFWVPSPILEPFRAFRSQLRTQ